MAQGDAARRAARTVVLVRILVCIASALLLGLAGDTATGAKHTVPKSKTIQVAATTKFAATGVVLAKGEKAKLTATGLISYGSLGPESCRGQNVPPSGCAAEAICPRPGPCGALVGRLNGGAPFLVAESKTVTGPGSLELGINDGDGAYGDNFGSFTVTIARSNSCPIAKTAVGRSGSVSSAAKRCFTLSGRVFERKCVSSGCADGQTFVPSVDRPVILSGARHAETKTGPDGKYTLRVKKGTYGLRVAGVSTPRSRTVSVTHDDVHNLDFHLCRVATGKAVGCDLVELGGRTVAAVDDLGYGAVIVQGPGDGVHADSHGRFHGLLVPRGKVHITATADEEPGPASTIATTVNATRKVNTVTLKLPLRLDVRVQTNPASLDVEMSGLPLTSVLVRIARSQSPPAGAQCGYRQSQKANEFKQRGVGFIMQSNAQDGTFCNGNYLATVEQGNLILAKYRFLVEQP